MSVDLRSALFVLLHTQGAQALITQLYVQITPRLPLPCKRSPDGASSNCSILLIYLSRKDERLSRPGWLTYSGQFSHITGHPQDAGQGKIAGQRLTFYHCAT